MVAASPSHRKPPRVEATTIVRVKSKHFKTPKNDGNGISDSFDCPSKGSSAATEKVRNNKKLFFKARKDQKAISVRKTRRKKRIRRILETVASAGASPSNESEVSDEESDYSSASDGSQNESVLVTEQVREPIVTEERVIKTHPEERDDVDCAVDETERCSGDTSNCAKRILLDDDEDDDIEGDWIVPSDKKVQDIATRDKSSAERSGMISSCNYVGNEIAHVLSAIDEDEPDWDFPLQEFEKSSSSFSHPTLSMSRPDEEHDGLGMEMSFSHSVSEMIDDADEGSHHPAGLSTTTSVSSIKSNSVFGIASTVTNTSRKLRSKKPKNRTTTKSSKKPQLWKSPKQSLDDKSATDTNSKLHKSSVDESDRSTSLRLEVEISVPESKYSRHSKDVACADPPIKVVKTISSRSRSAPPPTVSKDLSGKDSFIPEQPESTPALGNDGTTGVVNEWVYGNCCPRPVTTCTGNSRPRLNYTETSSVLQTDHQVRDAIAVKGKPHQSRDPCDDSGSVSSNETESYTADEDENKSASFFRFFRRKQKKQHGTEEVQEEIGLEDENDHTVELSEKSKSAEAINESKTQGNDTKEGLLDASAKKALISDTSLGVTKDGFSVQTDQVDVASIVVPETPGYRELHRQPSLLDKAGSFHSVRQLTSKMVGNRKMKDGSSISISSPTKKIKGGASISMSSANGAEGSSEIFPVGSKISIASLGKSGDKRNDGNSNETSFDKQVFEASTLRPPDSEKETIPPFPADGTNIFILQPTEESSKAGKGRRSTENQLELAESCTDLATKMILPDKGSPGDTSSTSIFKLFNIEDDVDHFPDDVLSPKSGGLPRRTVIGVSYKEVEAEVGGIVGGIELLRPLSCREDQDSAMDDHCAPSENIPPDTELEIPTLSPTPNKRRKNTKKRRKRSSRRKDATRTSLTESQEQQNPCSHPVTSCLMVAEEQHEPSNENIDAAHSKEPRSGMNAPGEGKDRSLKSTPSVVETTLSTEHVREKLFIKARIRTKPSLWSRMKRKPQRRPHAGSVRTAIAPDTRKVETFEPEHVPTRLPQLPDTQEEIDRKSYPDAGHSFDGQSLHDPKSIMSDLSGDSVEEVENALKTLRKHAKRLGLKEADLILAVKSEESVPDGVSREEGGQSLFSEDLLDIVSNYFRGSKKERDT